jgi:response regulator RpfG family c-di-GMP phosphodiesterase
MTSDHAPRVLFVDDDVNLLHGIARQFRTKFDVSIAEGGIKGLEAVTNLEPFAVVVSDMRMPDMNGIQFLSRVREISPNTVRIMLTGNSEIDTAMHAVNEGNIFRFLLKPCRKETIELAVEAAVEQHCLLSAERELLEKTLKGSVQMLIDVLSLASPSAFSRSSRIRDYVCQAVSRLNVKKIWELEIAALLSQIGWIALPTDLVTKVHNGAVLSADEVKMFRSHPALGGRIVGLIPRLENVSRMIAHQMVPFRDIGLSAENIADDTGLLGAQILKACIDLDTLILGGLSHRLSLGKMRGKEGDYHPAILRSLEHIEIAEIETAEEKQIYVHDLTDSMILAQNVYTRDGILLAPKGLSASLSLRVRLENYRAQNKIENTIRVIIQPTGATHMTFSEALTKG